MTTEPKMPEALRLADALDELVQSFGMPGRMNTESMAAAELRRLHERVAELEQKNQQLLHDCNTWAQEVKNEQRLSFRTRVVELERVLDVAREWLEKHPGNYKLTRRSEQEVQDDYGTRSVRAAINQLLG